MIDRLRYDGHDRVDQPMPHSPGSDQESGITNQNDQLSSFWLVILDPWIQDDRDHHKSHSLPMPIILGRMMGMTRMIRSDHPRYNHWKFRDVVLL